ncbi:MAG: 4-hydroxythreonine-4-phosphate dehydrogenase PdxA, partial [Lawsonibacter sp.]
NRDCVGRDAATLLKAIDVTPPQGVRVLLFEGPKEHPLIAEELMMPILGMVRARNIDAAMAEGIEIPEKKPTPPDTVFSKALGGWYDIVVVMYHDQGHIPLKVKGFVYNKAEGHWDAVAGINVTLGLPIIRASVDHGTGFGHAGSGHANELSLVNAIDYAITLANYRRK